VTAPCIVIADDDPLVTESIAYTLDAAGATIVLCGDTVAAELALERLEVTHVLADVQFTGEFSFEGLQFATRARRRNPECRVVLMSGYATTAMREAATCAGADVFLIKPFTMERLERVLELPRGDGGASRIVRVPSIEQCIHGDGLSTAFQPIVSLPTGTILGYEALTRCSSEWPFEGAATLFDYAARSERLRDLDTVCIERSIRDARTLPPVGLLFVNVDPVAFSEPYLRDRVRNSAAVADIDLSRVVLEITERDGFGDEPEGVFDDLRAEGIRFALDDVGSAYSHFSMIERIQPSFMKIAGSFGSGFERDRAHQRIVRHVVDLARDFECDVVLEGVETADTARAAADYGIPYAQGWHFGRPVPPSELQSHAVLAD
jgi:EAL domain-containing protein (putative c-di-GMP-specific phosphodiesterase class I)/ActR/RegA family two-component response regulator